MGGKASWTICWLGRQQRVNSLAGRQQQLVVVRSWVLMTSLMHCLVHQVGRWETGEGWVGGCQGGTFGMWVGGTE